jgi:hypothetical protein
VTATASTTMLRLKNWNGRSGCSLPKLHKNRPD